MEKTAKVIEARPTGRKWEGKNGINHVHYIEFDNGEGGEYNSMSEHQDKFKVGEQAAYERTPGKGTYPDLIKPVKKEFVGGKKGYEREPFWERAIGFATSYTKDLIVADKLDIKQLEPTAERMYAIMMKIYNAQKSQQNGTV